MKKNRTMRAAALLLALTLMTSCFVGGTFAKYTTTDSATDTARVAKWGIEVLASGNLFGEDYNPHSAADEDKIGTVKTSVSSSDTDMIVAPGTKNSGTAADGLTLSITGTPEVSYKVIASATGVQDIFLGKGSWGVLVEATGLNAATVVENVYYVDYGGGSFGKATGAYNPAETYYEMHDEIDLANPYYPLNWAVVASGDELDAIAITKNLTAIADAMVAEFTELNDVDSVTGSYANDQADAAYVLTWEWPFENAANNVADTILGNLMAGKTASFVVYKADGGTYYNDATLHPYAYSTSVVFDFTLTVEQTD